MVFEYLRGHKGDVSDYFIFLKNNYKLACLFMPVKNAVPQGQFIVFPLRASLNLQLHFFVFLWANTVFLERSQHSWEIKKITF